MTRSGIQSQGPPPRNSWVTIHHSLLFEGQDEPYDSTFMRGIPEKYKINDGKLFPGMEEAIYTMKLKERALFLIRPDYAFGKFWCLSRIPPNAKVMADIELVGFVEEDEKMFLWLKTGVTFKEVDRVVSQVMEQGKEAYLFMFSPPKKPESLKHALQKCNSPIRLLEFMEKNIWNIWEELRESDIAMMIENNEKKIRDAKC